MWTLQLACVGRCGRCDGRCGVQLGGSVLFGCASLCQVRLLVVIIEAYFNNCIRQVDRWSFGVLKLT